VQAAARVRRGNSRQLSSRRVQGGQGDPHSRPRFEIGDHGWRGPAHRPPWTMTCSVTVGIDRGPGTRWGMLVFGAEEEQWYSYRATN